MSLDIVKKIKDEVHAKTPDWVKFSVDHKQDENGVDHIALHADIHDGVCVVTVHVNKLVKATPTKVDDRLYEQVHELCDKWNVIWPIVKSVWGNFKPNPAVTGEAVNTPTNTA